MGWRRQTHRLRGMPAWIVNLAHNAAVPRVIEAVRRRALAAD
jgi:hypothetical protein